MAHYCCHLIPVFLAAAGSNSQPDASSERMVAIFIAEIALLLFAGRLLGELMRRIGQPAVMGQLIAGILIGQSVLGKLWPAAYQTLFPDVPDQKKMLEAISQLGILMLLLLTGMETDLSIVRKARRAAFFGSISGILVPFACGFALGEFLPESMLPNPGQRMVTSLFLATALSISSIKIVAMVIMEVGFLRRNIGQLILASAILDDTTGWLIIAVIGGLASRGRIDIAGLLWTVGGTAFFLVFSFTIGKRAVAYIIRWSNDRLTIELPVITSILIVMIVMALITEVIGVHTVLGAFVAGILIGQSPILTRHIEEQLTGLIVAFFSPVFFGVAGLTIGLEALKQPSLIEMGLALILIASFGKVAGCYTGGRVGGLSSKESLALGLGMNARGSTEVIVATIGLSMGVLNKDLFTLIVVMAIVTTMATPPLLRWALSRIPPTGEEKKRLEREAEDEKNYVPTVERILVAADASDTGKLASVLAGFLIGASKIMSTVLDLSQDERETSQAQNQTAEETVKASAELAAAAARNNRSNDGESNDNGSKEDGSEGEGSQDKEPEDKRPEKEEDVKTGDKLDVLAKRPESEAISEAILAEAGKGYDMIFLGLEGAFNVTGKPNRVFKNSIERLIQNFPGVLAIAAARGRPVSEANNKFNILVPTSGANYSRRAAEVGIAIAKGCGCQLTAMHVSPPSDETSLLRHPKEVAVTGRALVRDIQSLGRKEGVRVKSMLRTSRMPERAILDQLKRGGHDLLVIGVTPRSARRFFFGHTITVLLEQSPCSLLLVIS
jgi:Kef-type K+ transport system membrane component KefB/nucleotide-binding universal stress UspA family protein